MIGIDTNILLRATLNDDPVQSLLARGLLQSVDRSNPGLVSIAVVMEFFWVLRSRYKLPHARLAEIMRRLIEVEHLEFEAMETIGRAVVNYEGRSGDFPDSVIAMHNQTLGAARTVTVDREAADHIPSMTLLA